MGEAELIDQVTYDRLLESVGGDMDFVAELVQAYLADTPALFEDMRRAVAGGDAGELRRAAHSLKSGSSSFGAVALAALCKELEDMGKLGTLSGAEERIWAAQAAYQDVAEALRARTQPAG